MIVIDRNDAFGFNSKVGELFTVEVCALKLQCFATEMSFQLNHSLLLFHPSRWIKFEEKVEKGGERWSKPHVATLSLHSLFELRTCIEKGTILLDMEASTLPQVVGKFAGQ